MTSVKSENIIEIIDSSDENEDNEVQSKESTSSLDGKPVQHDSDPINHNDNGETILVANVQPKIEFVEGLVPLDRSDSNEQKEILSLENGDCTNGSIEVNDLNDSSSAFNESSEEAITVQNDEQMSSVRFNGNLGTGTDQSIAEIGKRTQQTLPPNTHQNELVQKVVELHKCKLCDFATPHEKNLKLHQRMHVNGKMIGVKVDSRGLYHCTHCVRRFTDFNHLSKHMKSSHKNDQYAFHCACCMRQFVRKAEKDTHESQCKCRHYECHLCKVYVTPKISDMQCHMRTHSGAKPFRCIICSRPFRTRSILRDHLNSIHSRRIKAKQ